MSNLNKEKIESIYNFREIEKTEEGIRLNELFDELDTKYNKAVNKLPKLEKIALKAKEEEKIKETKDEKETTKKRTRTEEKDTDLQKPTESKEGTEQALVEEAKKYKSADEFVENQNIIYHGTDAEFDKFTSQRFWNTFGYQILKKCRRICLRYRQKWQTKR